MAIRYHSVRDYGNEVSVRAISSQDTEESRDNGHPIADLQVKSSEEVPNFVPMRNSPGDIGVHQRYSWYNPGKSVPTELFTHIPPQIKGAYADPRIRHVMPTMVGIAMNRVGSPNEVPMADQYLTAYSSALSRNAVKKNLAVPHYLNRDMSSGDRETMRVGEMPSRTSFEVDPEGWDAVPPEEVSAARSWVRERIRGPQKTKKQVKRGDSQFEQLDLGI